MTNRKAVSLRFVKTNIPNLVKRFPAGNPSLGSK
jgi:hypothetical protein